jgi:hypothetical protein
MDISYFSNCGADHMGLLVDCNIGSRHNWASCGDGWHCSSTGILFNYAMVENTMAKLKYVAVVGLILKRLLLLFFLCEQSSYEFLSF